MSRGTICNSLFNSDRDSVAVVNCIDDEKVGGRVYVPAMVLLDMNGRTSDYVSVLRESGMNKS